MTYKDGEERHDGRKTVSMVHIATLQYRRERKDGMLTWCSFLIASSSSMVEGNRSSRFCGVFQPPDARSRCKDSRGSGAEVGVCSASESPVRQLSFCSQLRLVSDVSTPKLQRETGRGPKLVGKRHVGGTRRGPIRGRGLF